MTTQSPAPLRQDDWTVPALLEEWFAKHQLSRRKLAFLERAHQLDVERLERGEPVVLNQAPYDLYEDYDLPPTNWSVVLAFVLDFIESLKDKDLPFPADPFDFDPLELNRLPDIVFLQVDQGLISYLEAAQCLLHTAIGMSEEEFTYYFGMTPETFIGVDYGPGECCPAQTKD